MKKVANISRYVVASILLLAAIGKLLDLPGYYNVMEGYRLFPTWSLWPIVIAMPLIELLIALMLFANKRVQQAAWGSVILHAAFAIVLVIELIRGIDLQNCGCFGVFLSRPLSWATPLEDVFMIVLSYLILKNTTQQKI